MKAFLLFVVLLGVCHPWANAEERPPNIVLIFLDDSGWADFHPFGNPAYPTPNVEKLAAEGRRFTQFYVPQAICSASRAALLTGCYPERTKVFGAHAPRRRGLDPRFSTIAEMLKKNDYATACFGKWHLGDHVDTRPPARGFDESAGLMYSNDMWEFHPENPEFWGQFPLQFWENGKVTIDRVTKAHQPSLTTWYTEHAVDFIHRQKEKPFFLYVPHSMPHVPLFVSDKFKGESGVGLYGDVMMELDWSVGQITQALKDSGVEEDTLVVFTSDNGPWISYGNHAGATPFREAKGTSFDGGTRSACIMKWPGKLAPGSVSGSAFGTIDILPTIARLTNAPLPTNAIDGRDVWDLIVGKEGAENPHEYYAFTNGNQFEGVMSGDGRWKLHLPHTYRTLVKAANDGAAGQYSQERIGLSLYDLKNDPNETTDVKEGQPNVLATLQRLAEAHQKQFFDDAPDDRLVMETGEALFPKEARIETLATGLQFTEGPVWLGGKDGRLIFSDIPANRLYQWEGGGLTVFREGSGNTNGNALDLQGRLLHCEHGGRRVSLTTRSGSVVPLVTEYAGKALNSPNDIVAKRDGTLWFTDPDYGLAGRTKEQDANGVYRFDPLTNTLTRVASDFDEPNGLAFSPDETTAYVADSGSPRHIRALSLNADGGVKESRVFAQIDQGGPDGIRCDERGNVWSSSGDGAQVFSPEGVRLARIRLPKGAANLCFGGNDGRTLFLTARDGVYSVHTKVRDARDD